MSTRIYNPDNPRLLEAVALLEREPSCKPCYAVGGVVASLVPLGTFTLLSLTTTFPTWCIWVLTALSLIFAIAVFFLAARLYHWAHHWLHPSRVQARRVISSAHPNDMVDVPSSLEARWFKTLGSQCTQIGNQPIQTGTPEAQPKNNFHLFRRMTTAYTYYLEHPNLNHNPAAIQLLGNIQAGLDEAAREVGVQQAAAELAFEANQLCQEAAHDDALRAEIQRRLKRN
jgi:hypothetical protein